MANTRKKIVVLINRNDLARKGLSQYSIVDAQVSGNRATPFAPGSRTIHLTRGQWRFATADEVAEAAKKDHHLASKSDPTTGDVSVEQEPSILTPVFGDSEPDFNPEDAPPAPPTGEGDPDDIGDDDSDPSLN